MVVTINRGSKGIREYLEHGRKKDRDFSREELDRRVVIDGDLDITDSIIQSIDNQSTKYYHFTLSFKEDYVSEEDFKMAFEKWKKFTFGAYSDEEYNLYAEIHYPKMKSYTDKKTGELKIRKPHMHIVVPEVNLLSGERLKPLGFIKAQSLSYIDAFAEKFNMENGFASPKKNHSNLLKSHNISLREEILSDVIKKKIDSYEKFEEYLKEKFEDVKVRNEYSQVRESYFNIRPEYHKKGTNLNDYVFSKDFIENKSLEEKKDFLSESLASEEYLEKDLSREIDKTKLKEYSGMLDYWDEIKAKEIKYISQNTTFYKKVYKNLSNAEKIEVLNQREKQFYEKHDLESEIKKEVRGITMDDIKQEQDKNKEIEDVRFKKNNALKRADAGLYKSASVLFGRELKAENSNDMRALSESGLVSGCKRVKELLSSNEVSQLDGQGRDESYNQMRWSDDGNHRNESSSGKIVSHERKLKVENLAAQKLHDFYEKKSLENLEIKGDLILNTYDILSKEKGVMSNKIKYDEVEKSLFINSVSPRRIGVLEFLSQEMNLSANEIQDLQNRIYEIEIYHKENKMAINVNIKLNNRNPQKVDYYQMGREDVAGRFTGVIHDRASQFDTARAFIVNDKCVSLEEFKTSQKEMFNEIADKTAELFNQKTSIRYQDTLRMDVMNTEVSLTDRGKVYAHSQFNMRDMTPVEMGVTRFDKKLDKNFFTIAKEWITAKEFRDNFKVKVHEFKERVKSIITSRPELAASNVAMAIQLKQLQQDLHLAKTYLAAQEIASKQLAAQAQLAKPQEQVQQQDQEKEKDPNEMSFKEVFSKVRDLGDVFENARDGVEFVGSEEFKDKRNTAMELISNLNKSPELAKLSEQEVTELNYGQAKAVNIMFDKGIPVENISGVDKFLETLKQVKNICDLNVNLDFSEVLNHTLDKLAEQSMSKEQIANKQAEQDGGMERG